MALFLRWIRLIDSIAVLQESTARLELAGEKRGGKIRAAASQEVRATCGVGTEESWHDQYGVLGQQVANAYGIKTHGLAVERGAGHFESNLAWIDNPRRDT